MVFSLFSHFIFRKVSFKRKEKKRRKRRKRSKKKTKIGGKELNKQEIKNVAGQRLSNDF